MPKENLVEENMQNLFVGLLSYDTCWWQRELQRDISRMVQEEVMCQAKRSS